MMGKFNHIKILKKKIAMNFNHHKNRDQGPPNPPYSILFYFKNVIIKMMTTIQLPIF